MLQSRYGYCTYRLVNGQSRYGCRIVNGQRTGVPSIYRLNCLHKTKFGFQILYAQTTVWSKYKKELPRMTRIWRLQTGKVFFLSICGYAKPTLSRGVARLSQLWRQKYQSRNIPNNTSTGRYGQVIIYCIKHHWKRDIQ
jgi:hypothetical protein